MTTALAVVALLAAGPAAPPTAAVVQVESPDLLVEFLEDPDTRAWCGGVGVLSFTLAEPATVSLSVDGRAATAAVDGQAPRPLQQTSLLPGRHEAALEVAPWSGAPAASPAFRLDVRSGASGAVQEILSLIHI